MATTKEIDLQARLSAARIRLHELIATKDESADLMRTLVAAVAISETAAKAESEQSLIESREPDRKLITAPESLKVKLAAVTAQHETIRGAVARLQAAVDQIEGEIRSRRHSDVLAKIQPLGTRLAALMDEAAAIAWQIDIAIAGETIFAQELFVAGERSQEALGARTLVMATLVRLLRARSIYSPELRKQLGFVEPPASTPVPSIPIPDRPELYMSDGIIYRGARPS